jgi:hypothetical protein
MSDVLNLNTYEEHIYNTFLRTTRTRSNQPFKYRKDFTTLPDKTKSAVKKIAYFLQKFEHIKIDDFFIAPYKVYADETYFELEYYTSLKATKAYTLYQKKKIYSDPDSEEQLANIKDALQFISTFCKDNNLQLENYLLHKEDVIPSFLIHLKEHKVNIFVLLGFTNFTKELSQVSADMIRFIIDEEMYNKIDVFRTKLFASEKAKHLVAKGLQKIQTILKENS